MQMHACKLIRVPEAKCSLSVVAQPRPSQVRRHVLPAVSADTASSGNGSTPAVALDAMPNAATFEGIAEIVRMVNSTDIVELELKSSKFQIAIRKREASVQVVQAAPVAVAAVPMAMPTAMPARSAPVPAAPAAPAAPPKVDGVEVMSPMSGSFYHRPAPGEPPFVKVGDRVKKGQTVGIIEAMKLMNEIEAEVGGEVVAILVESGSPVTPGTPLMVIKP